MAMTLQEICYHENQAMRTRRFNPEQQDQHLWEWLLEMLHQWSLEHPIQIKEEEQA